MVPYAASLTEFETAGKLVEGQAFLDSLQQSRASDENLATTLGLSYDKANQPDKAVEVYKKLLVANDKSTGIRWALANLYDKMGKTAEASAEYKTLLDQRPDNNDARLKYAATLEKLGKSAEALAEYKKVQQTDPANEEAGAGILRLEPKPVSTDTAPAGNP